MTGKPQTSSAFQAAVLDLFDHDRDGILNEREQAALDDILAKSQLPTADYLKLGQGDWDAISELDFAQRLDQGSQRTPQPNEAFT